MRAQHNTNVYWEMDINVFLDFLFYAFFLHTAKLKEVPPTIVLCSKRRYGRLDRPEDWLCHRRWKASANAEKMLVETKSEISDTWRQSHQTITKLRFSSEILTVLR